MARTPYVTVRGTEPAPPAPKPKETVMPEAEEYPRRSLKAEDGPPKEEKAKPIGFDAEEANELLDIVHNTKDLPNLNALNKAAMINLMIIAAEIEKQLEERAEEAKKKGEEEAAAAAKKAAAKKEDEKEKEDA